MTATSRERPPQRALRRSLLRTLGIAAASAIVLFVFFRGIRRVVLPLPMDRCQNSRFDPDLWRDSSRAFSSDAIRGCMVDDLLARSLKGMSKDSLVALLGPPSRSEFFAEYDLVYWLGPERGMRSADSEWLVIRLDTAGHAREVKIVTDKKPA